jgi:hypothetical protein
MSDKLKDKKRKTSSHKLTLQRNFSFNNTNGSDYSSSIESASSQSTNNTLGGDNNDTKITKKKKNKISKEELYLSLKEQEKALKSLNGLYTTIVNTNLILNSRMNELEKKQNEVKEEIEESSSGFCGIYSLFNLIFDY